MSTKVIKIDPVKPQEAALKEAASVLAKGGLVIIPTETVYGIAADGNNAEAVKRLYQVKERPENKPFSLHINAKEKVEDIAKDIPVAAYKLMEAYWPGPLTLILRSKQNDSTIGVRVPDNEIARLVIALSGAQVVCPSANISGEVPPVDFKGAIKELDGLVDLALDAGKTRLGKESTIVDATVEPVKVVREGALKKEDIEKVVRKKTVLFICTGNSCRSVMAQALLQKKLKEKGRDDVEVLSAGIMMMGGMSASFETQELLAKQGIDVSSHISRRVTKEMLRKADFVLVMEHLHEERILQIDPGVRKRLFLLKEFAGTKDNHLDIVDPMGQSVDFYQDTLYIIKEAVEKVSSLI